MQRNKEQELLQQYGIGNIKEQKNWKDYVKQYKNLNTIHNNHTIPEMYQGYPGIQPGTIPNTLNYNEIDNQVIARRYKNGHEEQYIVNINDFYDDEFKTQRLENSKKLYEIFNKERRKL